ncbi:MAG: alkaline phosphatase D family protein [Candidatus Sumerlaeia bacterium]|nr:alkaline phosphatase D family protein [Candidatus Sumerlaeia bacterium]
MFRLLAAVATVVSLLAAAPAQPPAPVLLERIAVGSCAHQDKPQPIWREVLAAKPDLFLFLGDNVYGKDGDPEHLGVAYETLAGVPGFQLLRETTPMLATWDDHDFGLNDAGADYEHREDSLAKFHAFFQTPEADRRPDGVYHARVYGPEGRRTQVLMLDTRFNRSPLEREAEPTSGRYRAYLPTTTEGATFLGEAQWKWLEEQLRQPAELRLVVSSIQVVPEDHPFEKWSNIPAERERLFKLIADTGADGVVFVTGDRHLAEISMIDGGVGYPLYDLTASALTNSSPRWRPQEPNRHRVATMNWGNNFGLIEVDWHREDPLVRLKIVDADGETTLQQKFPLSTLRRGFLRPPAQ